MVQQQKPQNMKRIPIQVATLRNICIPDRLKQIIGHRSRHFQC